jgi:UDP-GlcNAc:undecaprenyl-phosphate GlcNAc-1-phosphate transferase
MARVDHRRAADVSRLIFRVQTSWTYLAAAVVTGAAIAVTAILCPFVRRRAESSGHVDRPGGRKTQPRAVPYGGGIAVFCGFLTPLALGALIGAAAKLRLIDLPPFLVRHLGGFLGKMPQIAAILIACLGMLWMGRIDDRKNLSPRLRLLLQIAAAALVSSSGLRITLFLDSVVLHHLLTIFWIVFVMNACNFIDNMDGLLTGVLLPAIAALTSIAAATGQLFVVGFGLSLAGSLAAFLVWNRPPARLYIGDEGSMFVGCLTATLAIALSFRGEGQVPTARWIVGAAPLLALLVPIADGILVITTRLASGRSPMSAGLDHTSHRLERRGFGKMGATLFLIAISAFANAVVLSFYGKNRLTASVAFGLLLVAIAMFVSAQRARREYRATRSS